MASAELEQTTADIEVQGPRRQDLHAAGHGLGRAVRGLPQGLRGRPRRPRPQRAKGKEAEQSEDDDGRRLPPLAAGRQASPIAPSKPSSTSPQPPPRFSEATLVKRMEELGIGRPSTYASTLAVLQERDYVRIDKKRLIPEDKGRLVIAFLEGFFKRYVEYDFTADLEEKLDLISDGKLEWKDVLRDFWREFTGAVERSRICASARCWRPQRNLGPPHLPAQGRGRRPAPVSNCGEGRLSLKVRQVRRLHRLLATIPIAAIRASSPIPRTAHRRPRRRRASCSARIPRAACR